MRSLRPTSSVTCATAVVAVAVPGPEKWKRGTNAVERNAALEKALNFDALDTAEKICEGNCVDPQPLGFLLHMGNSLRKHDMLKRSGDTYFSMTDGEFVQVANSIGFVIAHAEPFDNNGHSETLIVMYHPEGVLLKMDTYQGNVNGANFYYNWEPHDKKIVGSPDAPKLTSSGTWFPSPQDIKEGRGTEDDWIWAGDWDAREGLKYNFGNLLKYGKFLKPWKYDCGLNLLHFVDWREVGKLPWPASSKECDRRTLERLRKATPEIQAMVPTSMFDV
jgi:hypothetical protein